jgi:protein FRA10AC1
MGQKQKASHFPLALRKEPRKKSNLGSDLFQRHNRLINYYESMKKTPIIMETEVDMLKKNHRFLRDDEQDDTWESRLAIKYYEKLFKEYCLGNFTRYKTGQIGLRWRTKVECVEGKGQFICGNLGCQETKELYSWEVNFGYTESGERKNALVKIRLCNDCSDKLHYGKKRKNQEASITSKKSRTSTENENTRLTQEVEENDKNPEHSENVWANPVVIENEKTKEEEMDDFLLELLL